MANVTDPEQELLESQATGVSLTSYFLTRESPFIFRLLDPSGGWSESNNNIDGRLMYNSIRRLILLLIYLL